MRLQQTSTFRPFMRESIIPAFIAGMAGYHKVIRPIAPTTRKRDDMINMICPFACTQLFATPIAFALLPLVLFLNIMTGMGASGLRQASPAVVVFNSPVCSYVRQLPICPLVGKLPQSINTPPSTRRRLLTLLYLRRQVLFICDKIRPEFRVSMVVCALLSIATHFTYWAQSRLYMMIDGEECRCGRFLFVALGAYLCLRHRCMRDLLYPSLLVPMVTRFAKRTQPISFSLVGIEEFSSGCKDLLTMGASLLSWRWSGKTFRDILRLPFSLDALLTRIHHLSGIKVVKVSLRLVLIASIAMKQYTVTHGKGYSFSSRQRMLAHRSGNNILLHQLYHKTAQQAS